MTASPDRPATADQFVVDTILINPLKILPTGTGDRLRAVGPVLVAPLQPVADRGKSLDDHSRACAPASLAIWPHPVPLPRRVNPVITDLNRVLDPAQWRFDLEHLPRHVADFLTDPDAPAYQFQIWLDRQHLPPYVSEEDQRAAAKAPLWPRVMLFYVPAPDHLHEPPEGRLVTISGLAGNLPGREVTSTTISLTVFEVCSKVGNILIRPRQPPVAGLYQRFEDVAYEQHDL